MSENVLKIFSIWKSKFFLKTAEKNCFYTTWHHYICIIVAECARGLSTNFSHVTNCINNDNSNVRQLESFYSNFFKKLGKNLSHNNEKKQPCQIFSSLRYRPWIFIRFQFHTRGGHVFSLVYLQKHDINTTHYFKILTYHSLYYIFFDI